MQYDWLIRGGVIVDGTGALPYAGDVAVRDGKICAVGRLSADDAERVLEAAGRLVCPGFIDAHAHSETSILRHPDGLHKLAQGITLELTGHCGGSVFPRANPNGKSSFADLASYRAHALAQGFAVCQGSLVGHGTMRARALGEGDAPLHAEGSAAMLADLDRALTQGALGMSSGLEYAPGMYSTVEEILPLARRLAESGAVYSTHMRSEGNTLLDAVDETLAVARQSGVTTVISHLKACGKPNHGKVAEVLAKMDAAVAEGCSVWGDCYPYTAGCTGLSIVLPAWTKANGRAELLRVLADEAGRAEIRRWFSLGLEVWENRSILTGWDKLCIAHVSKPENAGLAGKSLAELARIRGRDEIDAFLDLLLSEGGEVDGILFSACEDDVARAIAHPRVMICSDSVDVSGMPHPRLYGSHARYLARYADFSTDRGAADAIYKMTGLPASVYRLAGVGRLAPGYRADVVVFDPTAVRDRATFAEPMQTAEGIDAVFVGGAMAYRDGESQHTRTGAFVLPDEKL